jgi:hypothetical protein
LKIAGSGSLFFVKAAPNRDAIVPKKSVPKKANMPTGMGCINFFVIAIP